MSDSSRATSSIPSSSSIPPLALALFVLFSTQVLGSLLPLRLLEPIWQLKLAATLTNYAPLALVGLGLQHLALELGTSEARLRRRHKRFCALSLLASLGFLLLIPLQSSASFRQATLIQDAQQQRIQNAEQRLAALRQAVNTATTTSEVNDRLRDLNGPVLGPADLMQTLPLLKAQVNAVLDQGALQIRRQRQANPPRSKLELLPDLLRNGIANLALAFGFAALGRRPGAYQSPIRELQTAWERRSRRQAARRSSPFTPLLDAIDRLTIRFWR